MKVASIQMAVVEGDKTQAMEKATALIRRCADADLIVLPELWNIGFMSFDRYIPEAESQDGLTLSVLRRLAAEVHAYLHTGSFVEKDGEHYYNSSYLISPQGELLGNYRKIHLFGYNSREPEILTPGDKVCVIATPLGKIGMAACYDLRYPELFRRMLDQGAEIFTICSAWPTLRLEHWLLLNRVRALENQCFLVSTNAVGQNQGVSLAGCSMMVDPWGVILAGSADQETILRCEFDPEVLHAARTRFPVLADRVAWLNPGIRSAISNP